MAKELSGPKWVSKFKPGTSLGDLKGSFKANMTKFYNAMDDAGASLDISVTYRPPERAYLMYYSYQIGNKGADASKVPALSGVDIDWTHGGDKKAAQKAAASMVSAYSIVYEPAYPTLHEQGLAIDVTISWSGILKIKDAKGVEVSIKSTPRTGSNKDLVKVGATYGVKKLMSDPPHWSSTGR